MIKPCSFFLFWIGVPLALAVAAEVQQPAGEKSPVPAFSLEELGPPTVDLEGGTAASPPRDAGVADTLIVTPVASDQSIIDELLEVRRRVGGVTSSSSRFQTELVRLIQADRQRSADTGGKPAAPVNLTAAAAETPQPQQLSARTANAGASDPQHGALQIAMFRALAEELEGLANQLEREDSFTAADALRERSGQLREQARRLWASFPAAREPLRKLPTFASGSPLDLTEPPGPASPTATLPSVPVPIPDPPTPPKPRAKR